MGFLQSPDPAKKLARQYGIRGLFSPELVPSVQPVVLLDDLSGGHLSDTPQRQGSSRAVAPAVAAEVAYFRFEVPSNVIARIDRISVQPAASGLMQFFFGSSLAAPASTAANAYQDGRLRLSGEGPSGQLSFDTSAASLAVVHYELGTGFDISPGWVIGNTGSFDFLEMLGNTANSSVNLSINWTEYNATLVR